MIQKLFPLVFLFGIVPASGWENHHEIMENIINTMPALKREYLKKSVPLPSLVEEREMIHHLAQELQINEAKVPVFVESWKPEKGKENTPLMVVDLLEGNFIDEPDQGMDQDLPASADPKNQRKWMGGLTGPTSQGFRHMFFAGFQWDSPLDTFQIPLAAVGQAPEYFEKLHDLSRTFFREGNLFWGMRTLLWSLHIMQDLHQPFHVTQVPSLRMIPWKNLFSHFMQHSTQTMANYHYAYEGLIAEYVKDARTNFFHDCFESAQIKPLAHIEDVIKRTRLISDKIGSGTFALFGNEMKDPEVNLPENKGQLDFYTLIHAKEDVSLAKEESKELPDSEVSFVKTQLDRLRALKQLRTTSCELMRSLSEYTWGELDDVFAYASSSSSSKGK